MLKTNHIRITALLLAVGVILGAFGAHTLKERLSADQLDSWKTAVLYLMIHGLAMLLLFGLKKVVTPSKTLYQSWLLFAVGIVLFSGSIMLLATQDILNMSMSWLGPITPIGGILFILGWLNLSRLRTVEE